MKKALFVVWCILMACSSANAQTNPTVIKFTQFFNANQPDSIYNLFSAQMKSALKIEGTKQLIAQVKAELGAIVGSREMEAKVSGLADFRLSFERPILELSLILNKDSVAGISQKAAPTKEVDSVETKSINNFSVDNSIGKLYGTLTLPKDKKKVPVVLMIGGSGPTDRNMNQAQALKTNSFSLLAKGLAENGIASLRYDKRGVGTSMGAVNASGTTLDDFINDANLFMSKLASDDRFSEIIVFGHSEGAAIGLVTSLQAKPAAYISICGYQNNMVTLISEQLKPALTPEDFNVFTEVADSLKAGKIVRRNLPATLAPLLTPSSQAFLMSTLKYDSSKEIQKLKIPVLVIAGSTDIQIPAEAAIQLAKMNKMATLKIIPEMNHVLKRAPSDRMLNVGTYNNPTLPLHEDLIPLLTSFIKGHRSLSY